MGEVDGDDVSQHYGDNTQRPREPGVYQRNVDQVVGRAEQVPPVSEWIRRQRDYELPLYRQEGEEVGNVVSQRYGYEGVDERGGDLGA